MDDTSSFTTPDQVAVELGRPASDPSSTERARWQGWIDRAERNIADAFVRRGTTVQGAITAGTVTAARIRDIVLPKIAESVNNPDRLTSITRSVDDGSTTIRRDGASAGKGDPLDLTSTDLDKLFPAARSRRGRVFSVMPR